MRLERWWSYPAPDADPRRGASEEWAEIVLAQARRVGADAPDERRAARRDAQRRPGLEPDRRADGAAHGPAGRDVRRRLRRRGLRARPTPGGSPTRSAPSHHELEVELHERPRRPARLDLAPRRAARRPLLGRLPRALRARRRARHGRALRAGRRRAVRRLPQAPRRVAGRDLEPRARPRCAARRRGVAPPRPRPRAAGCSTRCRRRDPVARLLASSGLVHADLRARALRRRARGARRRRRARRARHARRRARRRARSRPRCTSTRKLGLVDDMLTYFDRASMACSLEVRVPFLDHELVELCRAHPDAAQGAPAAGQARAAARGHAASCPDFVLDKRKRGFFNEAVGAWLAADGGAVVDRLLLGADPALRRGARPAPSVRARRQRVPRAGARAHAPLLLALIDARAVAGRVPAARVRRGPRARAAAA